MAGKTISRADVKRVLRMARLRSKFLDPSTPFIPPSFHAPGKVPLDGSGGDHSHSAAFYLSYLQLYRILRLG